MSGDHNMYAQPVQSLRPEPEVINVAFKRNHLVNMVQEMLDVIYSYADRVSLAEAVGSLELCKAQLLEEQHK